MSESTALALPAPPSNEPVSVWFSPASFENAQRMAKALVSSNMVPESYRDNMGNALIALDIAQRTGASPLMVMQNLHIIEGKPSWASQFVIAALNSCGRFTPLRFRVTDLGEREVEKVEWSGPKGERTKKIVKFKIHDKKCVAVSTDRATGEILEGPEVSIGMAIAEGWYTKPGSKWVTMEGLMLRYRSAKFFGNLYAPDVLMGMASVDERQDIGDVEYTVVQPAAAAPASAEAPQPDKPKRARSVNAALKGGAKTEPPVIEAGPADEPATLSDIDERSGDMDPGEDDPGEQEDVI